MGPYFMKHGVYNVSSLIQAGEGMYPQSTPSRQISTASVQRVAPAPAKQIAPE